MDAFYPTDDSVYFLPLGGAGEFGINFNVYGHAGKWLLVDCGMGFADERLPGAELLFADPEFLSRRNKDLVAMVITHAHEDHIGAIPYLWSELRCPIYATAFTASLIRFKLEEHGLEHEVKLHVVPPSGRLRLDPFDVEYIPVTHSIPEANALVIRTKAGTIFHTGDWKFDETPVIGDKTDLARLKELGDSGILALIGDSTNSMVPGRAGSEQAVYESFKKLFAHQPNRIVVTCFSSNAARIESVTKAALANDRHVALVGRSLLRIEQAARDSGYWQDLPPFVPVEEVGFLPRDKIVLIATGSQGEDRSALARIASGDHREITLEPDDLVIFSSRTIPGNEKLVDGIQSKLARAAIKVMNADDGLVHVSGHACIDELLDMYRLIRPKIAIPVHGNYHNLAAHAKLAQSCQIAEVLIPENGQFIRLQAGQAAVVGHADHGVLALDGDNIIRVDGDVMRERKRMMFNGSLFISLVLDHKGNLLRDAEITLLGLADAEDKLELQQQIHRSIETVLHDLDRQAKRDDNIVKEEVRIAARRIFKEEFAKKPVTEVHIIRV